MSDGVLKSDPDAVWNYVVSLNENKEYVDEAGKSRIERDAALKEIEVLKSKIDQLENLMKLKQLKDSIK